VLFFAFNFSMLISNENILPTVIPVMAQSELDAVWQVNDTIKLMPGWVEWTGHWYNSEPAQAIRDGFWFEYHTREYLIDTNDLFLKFDEIFNWTRVNDALLYFANWTDFEDYIAQDPFWWLSWSWNLDSLRYGISANSTFIDAFLEEDMAFVTVLCHITRVAEYLIGWSLGVGESFDLRSISLGKIETYEYCSDYTSIDRSIYSHFSAPSNILQQKGELFTATIYVDSFKQKEPSEWDRNIVIIMPSDTEVKTAETTIPSIIADIEGNVAYFTIQKNETLPISFTVVSGPYEKSFWGLFVDQLISPDVAATIIGFVILFPSSLQGAKMLRRRKTYNRLLDLMVAVYDEHKYNASVFEKEITNITDSIFKSFIDNKLTDEQLEKLLDRRDDLVARMQPPEPPKF
jgi:hypothetical protein